MRSFTLLIVEDLPANREVYRQCLLDDLSCAYDLLEAESVAEGLELCNTKSIDAILLDYALPDADGLAFLERLYAQSDVGMPPVVMMTGHGNERIAVQAMKLGAQDYLVKSNFTPKLLQSVMRSAILQGRGSANDRACLQRQLDRSESRLGESVRDRFFNLSIDLLAIGNFEGYFTRLNPAWEKILGFTNAELMSQPVLNFVHPDDRQATIASTTGLSAGDIGISYESRYRCKDGSYPWLLWSTMPYTERNSWYAAGHDITERKQAEAKLLQRELQLQLFVKHTPAGVAMFDLQMRFLLASDRWIDSYELTDRAIIGRSYYDVCPDLSVHWQETHRRCLAGAIESRQEDPFPRADGSIDWLHWEICPWYANPDEIGGIVIFSEVITERKQAQAILEQRNQDLDSFVHIVSHDLKAPLRAVSNLSEWIEEDFQGTLSAYSQQQMALLRSRVQGMGATIDGLLDYARTGQMDVSIEPVVLSQLLAEVIASIAPPPTFTIEVAPNLPNFPTKRLLLSQVFANLIGNGIKHHDRQDGSIQISSRVAGNFYEFAVSDNGPGIAPKDRERVFRIFQAVNPQNRSDSTGVGLAIVKKIVEAQGGTIWLESQLDSADPIGARGTTFYFTWPI
ncbi:PAS domain S-box protein [Chamaesiphon sp.]|uniref:PAS domain S-box protein n=1 Tax=Chamaesiphon sp. TaxID=2814140 RepID=UPI0035947E49